MDRRRSLGERSRLAGASLLEVLISVLILGVGMLGIAAMQATALRNSHSSLEQSQAVIQTYAILDAMRADRDTALAGGYDLALTCDVPAAGGELASAELRRWVEELKSGLGESACGGVACDASGCAVTVQWDDSRASDAGEAAVVAGAGERQTITRTRI